MSRFNVNKLLGMQLPAIDLDHLPRRTTRRPPAPCTGCVQGVSHRFHHATAIAWHCVMIAGWVLCVAAQPAAVTVPPTSVPGLETRPNIVFILADDLGFGDLGCYGSRDIRTPHLDRLAAEGVLLTQCYAASAVCTPTRVAFLTGHNPRRHGFDWVVLPGETRGLPGSERSLPALLRRRGYATGHFGKWHVGYTERASARAHGFDVSFGILSSDADYYTHRNSVGTPDLHENGSPVKAEGYLTDLFARRAADFVVSHRERPFFLYLAFTAPHWPFQPPGKPTDAAELGQYGPENGTRADYVRMVERMDDRIGQLLATIETNRLAQRTLVIFTGDNGGERLSDNGPLRQAKYTVWEGGIRVPGIVRWPGSIPANIRSSQCITTADWTVSALVAAGITNLAAGTFDGEDILPILRGHSPLRDRLFCWWLPQQQAIRSGPWKYVHAAIRPGTRPAEHLFDLDVDPGERRNLAGARPDVLARIRAELAREAARMSPRQESSQE